MTSGILSSKDVTIRIISRSSLSADPVSITSNYSGFTLSSYFPSQICIALNTRVTWVNNDIMKHTVTSSGNTDIINSKIIEPKENHTYTFNILGDYPYFDKIHPLMTGRVVVDNKSSNCLPDVDVEFERKHGTHTHTSHAHTPTHPIHRHTLHTLHNTVNQTSHIN